MSKTVAPGGTRRKEETLATRWFLESLVGSDKRMRLPLSPLPFRIGRRNGLDLTLPAPSISKEHAEIYEQSHSLHLRDLRSRNGTFVNRKKVESSAITEGDILHFADFEFRLGRRPVEGPEFTESQERTTVVFHGDPELPNLFVSGTRELEELIRKALIRPVFRPIVRLPEGSLDGFEVLGCGTHPDLPEDQRALFKIAASVGAEAELARLVRRKILERVGGRSDLPVLFLIAHPKELDQSSLPQVLRELRELAPATELVLQLHESAAVSASGIAQLRALLYDLRIGLAYDDFRLTQGRLLELAEVPPDYLTFDERFVGGLDQAPHSKRRMITSLVKAAREVGVLTLAQSVADERDVAAFIDMGFTHAQGDIFGPPKTVQEL